jgi:hypothetical protein
MAWPELRFLAEAVEKLFSGPASAIMIHAPDNTDSIIARLASRLEFFNSLDLECLAV